MTSRYKLPWTPIDKFCFVLLGLAFVIISSVMVSGCFTVTPSRPSPSQASWDGTNQNSGFYGFTSNHIGIISMSEWARYDGLIDLYAGKFIPRLQHGAGTRPGPITNGNPTILIDPEHLGYLNQMQLWRDRQVPPAP